MGLRPLRRAEESRLLTVPARIHQRALRAPAAPDQRTDRLGFAEHRHLPRERIPGAVDPAVTMIAADHPLIRTLRPADLRNHVVEGLEAPVRADRKVHLRRPRSEVIGDRQRAAPARRRHRSTERRKQRLCVRVGDRDHRDLEDRRRLRDRQALGVLGRTDPRGKRIAGVQGDIENRAALHALRRPPAAARIDVPPGVAVLVRIGVDDAADGAVLLGELGLQSAPTAAVAGDDDLAAYVDAAAREILIVLRHAVVEVDEIPRHIAVGTVHVVRRHAVAARRSLVPGNRRLAQGRGEVRGRDQLQRVLLESWVQHLEGLDLRVPPPLAQQVPDELRIGTVVRRADLVRLGREVLEPGAQLRRIELCIEALLERALVRRLRGRKAEHGRTRRIRRQRRGGRDEQRDSKRHHAPGPAR